MGGEDADKIIRVPGETLLIKVTPEEVAYRNKYLPDPTKLTDEKLVCTVCSVSLAQNVHKGKQIYIHRSLQVLVCEACFTFYGDGCFSVDEDGDDKYCRWCGQGGTLYLCSTCTCAFCQKCVKLNLKASVLADLENDDWKCYICSPRPLFGSRAICWGAEELNKMGKEKENEKLKKQKEKLGDKKKEETGRKSRKQSSSEDEVIPKKRRRGMNGSDDSSPEVMPAKRPTRASAVTRNLNGSLNKSKMKRRDSSSDIDISEEGKNVSKRSRINKKNKKLAADSSSDDDSEVKIQHKKKYKKKKAETSSDESLVEDYKIYKKRSSRKTVDSSDDESSDKKKLKKKKLSISKKKKEYSSDVSSDEKKKRVKRHKEDSNEESTDSYKKRSRKLRRKKDESSDSESEDPSKKEKKKDKFKKDIENKKKSDINSDDGEGVKGKKNNDDMILDENSEETRSKEGSSVDNLVKKRIKLAILWLDTAMKDIAELGSLISLRATKFAKKKINSENLKSYEDVLKIFSKLKQLMSGIHSNYDHIEKNLDNQLKPWKILTGLEESETDKPAEEETIFADKSVSDLQSISGNSPDSKNSKNQDVANNSSINAAHDNTLGVVGVETSTEKCDEKIKTKIDDESNDVCLKWDNLSGDEDSENDNLDMTEAITKATETLDKSDEQDDLQTSKIIIHDDSKHPKEDVDDIIHDDSKSSEKVIDDRSEKVDDRTVEDFNQNNVSNNFDSSTRMSQSESDEKHSDTDKKKSKKSGYKSLLGSSKSDYKNEDTKDEVEKDDILKIPVETVTEGKDSDSEISHKKEKPLHSSSLRKEKKEKIGEDSKYNDSSLKESPRKNFKEKGQCTGQHGNSSDDVAHLSDDSSGLESFSKRLKYKWQGKEQSDNMKLKTSLGLDSSGESDTSFEPEVSEKNKAHKKKNENKDENSPNCKNHNDKRNMEDDNNTKIKKKKHDDSKSKTRKQTRKKDDEESNDEKSVPNKVKEEVKEEIDFDHHEKSPNEDIESNGKLKKEKEKIEKDADIESFKTTDPMKTKLSTLDSSTEENDEKFKASKGSDSELKNVKNSKGNKKTLKKKSILNKRRSNKRNMLESSDEDDEQSDKNKKNDQLIVSSDDENKQSNKEDDKDSESPVYMLSSEESSDPDLIQKKKVKRKKAGSSDSDDAGVSKDKTKKKRKLIRCANSSDEIGESGEENLDASQKSTQGESPGKGGRKNIKKIKGKGDLEDATIEAAEEEKERRRRVEERQKLFNEMFEIKETKILDKLVLDFDEKEKKELISVHKDLVEKMKPHQAKGVKFMWDSCFESLAQLKKKKGTGCILAHCMGLGKTFQVISLVHTLLTNEETQVHTVMVVCPLSTVLNWYNEFDKWLDGIEGGDSIEVFHLTKCKLNPERARELRRWQNNGGVLIMGYEMFRNLTCETAKKFRAKMKKDFQETLVDPGADLIVCDEGHMLKNETTALSKAMSRVKSLRRIVLTGTPMQNNLKEYHCMVQFVKPNLLGTRKEFLNRFVNPISNGQFVDSTDSDVKLMKRRAHVLHKMLEGLVQRFDYNVLTPFLPPKHEFVISLCLSELQVKLYKHYLENYSQQSDSNKAGSRLFQDWQALGRIWTHPRVLKMSTDRANILKEKKMMEDSDEEGSLKDFIDDDDSEKDTTTEESGDDSVSDGSIKSDDGKKKRIVRNQRNTRSTRSSGKKITHLESSEDEKEGTEEPVEESNTDKAWWSEMVEPEHLDDINHSAKLVLLFAILKECEMIEDKVLVFSQSLFSLDLIEYFLDKIDTATQENRFEESLGNHQGTWAKGLDYFRLDGSTSSENRNIWCKAFNREDNARARLFLISTRAGGLGINLTAANRVIIFDASWNPSHDVQSIFRVYRFGQRKPCYVYRFIAHGTMEEKVYDRQVAKQSMSNRVVDEQQVHRHFSMNDLNELYSFTPPSSKDDRPTPALPKDGLMAEILTQFSDWIEKYHEHDSLLENVVEEELNEEERKAAWEDYENDKKRGFIPQTTGTTTGMFNNPMSLQIENLRRVLKAKYPTKPEHELNQMLVYQVSLLMRQQQYGASGQMGMNAPRPQMYQTNNLTPDQLYNLQQQQYRMQYLQQLQMNPTQQSTANLRNILSKQPDYQQQMLMQQQANLARLQMQQNTSHSFLQNQLTQPSLSQLLQIPSMTSGAAAAAAQLERMSKNYQESRKGDSSIEMKNLSSKPEQTKKPST